MNNLQINTPAVPAVQTEVRAVLEKFQDGYTRRDPSILDAYMEDLFTHERDLIIMGTSSGELCIGLEQGRQLFESDWKYWGDLRLNIAETEISAVGETVVFATPCKIIHSFPDSPERDANFIEFVQEELARTEASLKARLTTIACILAHAYHQRTGNPRTYHWPLTITGVMLPEGGVWKICYLQFSYPVTTPYADQRLETGSEYVEMYNKQREKLRTSTAGRGHAGIRQWLTGFVENFAAISAEGSAVLAPYLTPTGYFIGTDGLWHRGSDAILDTLKAYHAERGEIKLDSDDALITVVGDLAWILAGATFTQTVEEDAVLQAQVKDLEQIMTLDLPAVEKLFRIQRNLSLCFKELTVGTQYTIPFRFEGFAVRTEQGWRFHHLQFSYPFYWILEGKINGLPVE